MVIEVLLNPDSSSHHRRPNQSPPDPAANLSPTRYQCPFPQQIDLDSIPPSITSISSKPDHPPTTPAIDGSKTQCPAYKCRKPSNPLVAYSSQPTMFLLKLKVAESFEYLAITGFRIRDVKVAKKAWIFPGQKCRTFNVAPVKFSPEVRTDKILVVIRSVFMVGPRIDDESLLKYARFITTHQEDRRPEVEEIITQEVRKVSSRLTLDEIFFASLKLEDKVLEDKVTEKVKELLIPLGLVVYSSSYKQFVHAIGLACCSIHNPREADVMHKLAEARTAQADADAKLAEARAMKASTDAESIKLEVDAKLYATLKEAECKTAMASSLEKARSVLGKDNPETSERTQIVLSDDVRLLTR